MEGAASMQRFLPLPLAVARPPAGRNDAWQPLEEHLVNTAEQAAASAATFGGEAVAYVAGLLHDVGKLDAAFKAYLERSLAGDHGRGPPHAIWGAALLRGRVAPAAEPALVLSILGHHAGLKDWSTACQIVDQHQIDHRDAMGEIARTLPDLVAPPGRRTHVQALRDCGPRGAPDLWIRFVFSSLVDADRLDARRHAEKGSGPYHEALPLLLQRLELAQRAKVAAAAPTTVNAVRREVYEQCLEAAQHPPGIFRLTVPTGGGKTRSGLAFALRHAVLHRKRRVFVVIPYTSIIDQNAQEYREILGERNVLEHHSQAEWATNGETEYASLQQVASESWDVPVVVTTTVQFFESLLGNHPTAVRKVHNIAQSVVILDEIQAFPPHLLAPTLHVLRDLVDHYGVTLVLSTATQPAFDALATIGLPVGREIVADPAGLARRLARVSYEYRASPIGWPALARLLRDERQALVIVNTRRQALDLVKALQSDGRSAKHLSTLLCPAHRQEVMAEVKDALASGKECLLVSTQIVEAGVDLDFPLVFRARAPLDRIVQAAGRCNREGRATRGRVVVFEPEEASAPAGPYRLGMGLAKSRLERSEDLADPGVLEGYFRELLLELGREGIDTEGIQRMREALEFEQVAQAYRIIDQPTLPVIVPYRPEARALARAWQMNPTRSAWRALQPYVVNLYERDAATMKDWLEPMGERLQFWLGEYSATLGMRQG
ncbi:MAG TPA: CRISPR-associated helicase Cas3', partial [Candidatus Thermoplasmatota archaeon]|nr:CRISPR-associated helicase Cas3' [Candidatus Thermoplasmatota archaeon]